MFVSTHLLPLNEVEKMIEDNHNVQLLYELSLASALDIGYHIIYFQLP